MKPFIFKNSSETVQIFKSKPKFSKNLAQYHSNDGNVLTSFNDTICDACYLDNNTCDTLCAAKPVQVKYFQNLLF